jgi:hypothetical protein
VAVPNASQGAFVAYSEAEAANVCTLLGLDASLAGIWVPKVAKYIRCNGLDEIRAAAQETVLTMRKAHRVLGPVFIADPWAYTVQVANGRWARSRELYLRLGLYENSLRAKVVGLVTHHLGAAWWATNPPTYMRQADCDYMLQANSKIRAQAPTLVVPTPPMRAFGSAEAFIGCLTLMELHKIVRFLKQSLFDHVLFDAAGHPFKMSYLDNAHKDIERTRNDVMHARAIPKSAYPAKAAALETLLTALDFDAAKTLANITAASPV